MSFVTHRGQRIHYAVAGSGPVVVLQHGLFLDAETWAQAGFVEAFADKYCVVSIDSLGHGLSDKPTNAALYAQVQRAGDIVAVMDDLGCEQAHLVGHSMGGWMSVGMAKYHPDRLASLTLGGWDPVGGVASALPSGMTGPVSFDRVIAGARLTAPAVMAKVTAEAEPGLRACWEALEDLSEAEASVLGAGKPTLLWCGRDDPYHDAMQRFTERHQLLFSGVQGDHLGAVMTHGQQTAKAIRAFIDGI